MPATTKQPKTEQPRKTPRLMDSVIFGSKSFEVDQDKGIIKGVSLSMAGPALGHGVHLDNDFIADVASQGAAKKMGLKCRFGHPNMCSEALGTFLGRFHNIKLNTDGSKAIGDLYLDDSAKKAPGGDLYTYVLEMAENNPDMFGSSIVFKPGRHYKKDEYGYNYYELENGLLEANDGTTVAGKDLGPEWFVECAQLNECDLVDSPAANEDGLFSAFSGESAAGQLSEFLELNPGVVKAFTDSPEILEILGNHGGQFNQFIEKYQATQAAKQHLTKGTNMDPVETTDLAATEVTPAPEVETPETELEAEVEATVLTEADHDAALATARSEGAAEALSAMQTELAQAIEDHGAENAAHSFAAGEGTQGAKDRKYAALEAENEALKAGKKPAAEGAPETEFTDGEEGKPKKVPFQNIK